MIRLLIYLLIVTGSVYTKAAFSSDNGQGPVIAVVGEPGQSVLLGPYFQILEDPPGDVTITDITLASPAVFTTSAHTSSGVRIRW